MVASVCCNVEATVEVSSRIQVTSNVSEVTGILGRRPFDFDGGISKVSTSEVALAAAAAATAEGQ